MTKVFWQERRSGQRLILSGDDETEVEVGAVRQTPRGFDALAKTNTYDPGRAQKGFATMEEAKEFVESFHPWEIFGGDWEMEVEPEVQSDPAATSASEAETPSQVATSGEAASQAEGTSAQTAHEENQPQKRGWQIWKKD